MIPSKSNKIVSIHITTYKKEEETNTSFIEMDRDKFGTKKDLKNSCNNKFICSICLNSSKDDGRKETPCPICQKSCEVCDTKGKRVLKKSEKLISTNNNGTESKGPNTKIVQTSKTDVAQGLDLLNEVLTVFQNKKHIDVQKCKRFKDAATSTECYANKKLDKLCLSKIQQYSIEENRQANENYKFTILNYCQPDNLRSPQHFIDLMRHKSSSIPQMKLDELKKSLKEKVTSKDTIEEVNRMFANVRKSDLEEKLETNRPMIRNGPRVLPVVKTCNYTNNDQSEKRNEKVIKQICKCCQSKDFNMSSGDSLMKPGCCHHFEDEKEINDKCICKPCCYYQNHYRKMQIGLMICENCRNGRDLHFQHKPHSNRSDSNDSG